MLTKPTPLLAASLSLAALLLLAACSPAETPTPIGPTPTTGSTAPERTPTMAGAPPTLTEAINTPSSDPSPTQTSQDDPLKLQPVTLELTEAMRTGNFTVTRTINLPPGFGIKVFATGLQHVRLLALSPEGELYASVRAEDRVVRLPDENRDGVADAVHTVADGLEGVHGITFHQGQLYAATETHIYRLHDDNGDKVADRREVLVDDMPTGGVGRAGGNHTTRTIEFGPDGKLYVSIGSSCNVCIEDDPRRAAISRYTADGQFEKVYSKGVRNAVGIEFHPVTGELWAVNNGRDELGEDVPPESVYKLKEDGDYGWPFCYGYRVPDETQNPPPGYCEKTEVPEFTIQAHSAPLGLTFYTGDQFPPEIKGNMFIAAHGSWDRKVRVGYKLLRVRFKDNQPDREAGDLMVEDFATGWLLDPVTGEHWGRPVDPLVAPDGSLFLTDDAAMAIYKIYYRGQ